MSRQKGKDPIRVMAVITAVLAALAVVMMLAGNALNGYRQSVLAARKAEVEKINAERDEEYALALSEYEQQRQTGTNLAWPMQKAEGWDVVDLTNYPLEDAQQVVMQRADVMNNGMLLVNEWHSRPEDFDESTMVSVGNYTDWKIGVTDSSVQLFPVAVDAVMAAVNDAAALGLQNYMIDEGYRTYEQQNTIFQKYVDKYKENLSGDDLIARAKRDANYPGTSEFNSGLSFTMKLYKRGDAAVTGSNYVETPEGVWMNENCWRYGLIFRFPKADFPLKGTADKSYKTGVSVSLRCYRYVGKGNAAVMQTLGLCLEEYIEYLQEHPHIAVFEDGVLRYEIVRQYVGDATSFEVNVAGNAARYTTSLDNMGYVVTVLEY